MTGGHANRKRVGLVSRWSAYMCRPPVAAGIRVLGGKNMIAMDTCRLRLVRINSPGLSSSNLPSDLLAG